MQTATALPTELWVPDTYRRGKLAPTGEPVRLATGQLLKPFQEVHNPEPTKMDGWAYDAPGHLRVMATIDRTHAHGELLHVTISLPDRLPTWPMVRAIRGAFFGTDVACIMLVPTEAEMAGQHPYTFHLWQTPSDWAVR